MMPDVREFSERLELHRPDGRHAAQLVVATRSMAWLEEHAAEWLHENERPQAAALRFERRRAAWLLGRYCAKRAVAALQGGVEPQELEIVAGVFGQPLVRGARSCGLRVSIAHSAGWAAAVAFGDEHPMGVDLEAIDGERIAVLRSQATEAEQRAAAVHEADEAVRLTWLWTAKEALAKTLGTGLMTPLSLYEVAEPRRVGGWLEAEFTNFAQYRAQTMFFDGIAFSLALPRRSVCALPAERIAMALARR